MRYLYLLRHAKSLWNDPTLGDFERPLSDRGLRDAQKIARHLQHVKPPIEMVLCSSALRTTQTLDALRSVLKSKTDIFIEDLLYTFDASEVLERVKKVPPDIKCVLVIGHNPAIQNLAFQLTSPGSLRQKIATKYPTAALAAIELRNRTWDISEPIISKSTFVTPADLD